MWNQRNFDNLRGLIRAAYNTNDDELVESIFNFCLATFPLTPQLPKINYIFNHIIINNVDEAKNNFRAGPVGGALGGKNPDNAHFKININNADLHRSSIEKILENIALVIDDQACFIFSNNNKNWIKYNIADFGNEIEVDDFSASPSSSNNNNNNNNNNENNNNNIIIQTEAAMNAINAVHFSSSESETSSDKKLDADGEARSLNTAEKKKQQQQQQQQQKQQQQKSYASALATPTAFLNKYISENVMLKEYFNNNNNKSRPYTNKHGETVVLFTKIGRNPDRNLVARLAEARLQFDKINDEADKEWSKKNEEWKKQQTAVGADGTGGGGSSIIPVRPAKFAFIVAESCEMYGDAESAFNDLPPLSRECALSSEHCIITSQTVSKGMTVSTETLILYINPNFEVITKKSNNNNNKNNNADAAAVAAPVVEQQAVEVTARTVKESDVKNILNSSSSNNNNNNNNNNNIQIKFKKIKQAPRSEDAYDKIIAMRRRNKITSFEQAQTLIVKLQASPQVMEKLKEKYKFTKSISRTGKLITLDLNLTKAQYQQLLDEMDSTYYVMASNFILTAANGIGHKRGTIKFDKQVKFDEIMQIATGLWKKHKITCYANSATLRFVSTEKKLDKHVLNELRADFPKIDKILPDYSVADIWAIDAEAVLMAEAEREQKKQELARKKEEQLKQSREKAAKKGQEVDELCQKVHVVPNVSTDEIKRYIDEDMTGASLVESKFPDQTTTIFIQWKDKTEAAKYGPETGKIKQLFDNDVPVFTFFGVGSVFKINAKNKNNPQQ